MSKEDVKKFSTINCVCCGYKISLELHDLTIDEYVDSHKHWSGDIGKNEYTPESQIWKGGIVDKIAAGYGSSLDGEMYYIGICDICTEENMRNGRLRYANNYLFPAGSYTEEELKGFEEKRNRENNLNNLLNNL